MIIRKPDDNVGLSERAKCHLEYQANPILIFLREGLTINALSNQCLGRCRKGHSIVHTQLEYRTLHKPRDIPHNHHSVFSERQQ